MLLNSAVQLWDRFSLVHQGIWRVVLMSKHNWKEKKAVHMGSVQGLDLAPDFMSPSSGKDGGAGSGWDAVTTLAVISDHQLHIAPVYLSYRALFRGGQTSAQTHTISINSGTTPFLRIFLYVLLEAIGCRGNLKARSSATDESTCLSLPHRIHALHHNSSDAHF